MSDEGPNSGLRRMAVGTSPRLRRTPSGGPLRWRRNSSITSDTDSSLDLVAGFRRQTLGFVNYRIKAYALLGEPVNRSIGLAGPVGFFETTPHPGRARF